MLSAQHTFTAAASQTSWRQHLFFVMAAGEFAFLEFERDFAGACP